MMPKASTQQMLELLQSTELSEQKALFTAGASLVFFADSLHENTLIHGFTLDCNIEIISYLLFQLMLVYAARSYYPNVYQENLSNEDAVKFQSRAGNIVGLLSALSIIDILYMIYIIGQNILPEPTPRFYTFLMYLMPVIMHEGVQLNNRMTATDRHNELNKKLISLFGQDKEFPIADLFTITHKTHYLTIEYSDNKSKADALVKKYQQLPGDLIMSVLAVFLANKLQSGRIIYEKNQIIVKLQNNQALPRNLNPEEFAQQLKNMLLCHKFLLIIAKKLCGSRTIELEETSLCLPTQKELQNQQLSTREQEILLEDSIDKELIVINFAKESTLEKINDYFLNYKQKQKPERPELRHYSEPVTYVTTSLFLDIQENKTKKEKVKTRKPGSFWSAAPVASPPPAPEIHDFGEFGIYNSSNQNTDDSTVIRKVETKHGAVYVRAEKPNIPAEIFQSLHLAQRRIGSNGLILTLEHPEEAFESKPVFAKIKEGKDKAYIATRAYKLEQGENKTLSLIIFTDCIPHHRTSTWPAGKEPNIPILNTSEEANLATHGM